MFKWEPIEKDTPIPLYYQLKNIILDQIQGGDLQPGDFIPTEAAFNEHYGISRTTIRQAIGELVMEGYLERQKGKGTYVKSPKVEPKFMNSIVSYGDQMRRLGRKSLTKVLELGVRQADSDEKVQHMLELEKDDQFIYFKRQRFADDEPIVVDEVHLTMACSDILEAGEEELAERGMYYFLFQKDETKIVHMRREIESVASSKELSKLLEMPYKSPIQLTTSLGFNKDRRPVEYTIANYRGDKTKFSVDIYENS